MNSSNRLLSSSYGSAAHPPSPTCRARPGPDSFWPPTTASLHTHSASSGHVSCPLKRNAHGRSRKSPVHGQWTCASGGAIVPPVIARVTAPPTPTAIPAGASNIQRGTNKCASITSGEVATDAIVNPASRSVSSDTDESGGDRDGGGRRRLRSSSSTSGSTGVGSSGSGAIDGSEERLTLAECRHFVNLTNGIEALPMLEELQLPYSFVRIQSTACEQQNLEALVSELDANLLISLALGHCCLVYDCGSRGRDGTPRALWYGLEFVRYTLSKLWLRQPCPALLRGKNVARNFDAHIRSFRQSTVRRLQYYSKYLPPGSGAGDPAAASGGGDGGAGGGIQRLRLYGVFRPTDHDHDASHFIRLLHRHQLPTVTTSGQLPPYQPAAAAAAATAAGQRQHDTGKELSGPPTALPRLPSGEAALQSRGGGLGECLQQLEEEGRREQQQEQQEQQLGVWSQGQEQEPGQAGLVGASGDGGCSGGGGSGAASWGAGASLGGAADGVGGRADGVGDGDGEVVLARYGFRLFRRGLSPAEWAARAEVEVAAAVAAARAEVEVAAAVAAPEACAAVGDMPGAGAVC
ncbi:hypothetical protein PLESTB_001666900 [Pleodorina starrii]|uniref:Uncharacterized protein n=1 Tax=Pleodorina starrii TaxID=330485 RepID=A0A9W6BYR9_9CHLO|nr:hypothetical protein PLESTM_000627900 [Pleodorina starrii]GLC60752.1 hypothetical protein PLESTB_001666900 [Pleodorina starrii]GLC75469.1 hypothetical protein PLESTF_001641100 [Pleodorina starrii]